MSIHNLFREILGVSQPAASLVQLRPELLTAVEEIAARDGRSVGEVANDMIHFALREDRIAERNIQTWQELTPREKELTALIWLGLTNPQIAQRLSISQNTVKTHIRNILAKFNANGKEALREKLYGLDLSDWTDLGADEPTDPILTDSPDGANP
jgi:DNA-binding CsgD family transcriptional regulator